MSDVWLDIMTTKQVWFYGTLATYLNDRGIDTWVTVRKYQENTEVLEQCIKDGRFSFDYEVTGVHGGQDKFQKLATSLERMRVLLDGAKDRDIACSVGLNSPECARVSYGLGIAHLCTSDSPFAVHACRLSLPFSAKLITSWLSRDEDFIAVGADPDAIVKFKGIDEIAWTRDFTPNPKVLDDIGVTQDNPIVVVRALSPHFQVNADLKYAEDDTGVDALIAGVLDAAGDQCQIVAVPRYGGQGPALKKRFGDLIKVIDHTEGPSLNCYASVLVSAGGTMAREAALLGTFAVSMDPLTRHPMAYGEKFLDEQGLMLRTHDVGEAVAKIRELVASEGERRAIREKAAKLRDDLEDPIPAIHREISNYLA